MDLPTLPRRMARHHRPWIMLVLMAAALPMAAMAAGMQDRVKAPAAKVVSPLTLEQAVLKVQNETGGKVLFAGSQGRGRTTEYRIKVLTPNGHVRVVSVSSDPAKNRNTKE